MSLLQASLAKLTKSTKATADGEASPTKVNSTTTQPSTSLSIEKKRIVPTSILSRDTSSPTSPSSSSSSSNYDYHYSYRGSSFSTGIDYTANELKEQASLLLYKGERAKAVVLLTRALEKEPDFDIARNYRCGAYLDLQVN